MEGLFQAELVNGKPALEGKVLTGVEHYQIKISSELPEGTAELEIKMLVNFSDNTPVQNL